MELKKHLKLSTIMNSDNVAELMDTDDLTTIGEQVFQGYQSDKDSRGLWETRYAEAMNLAMQVMQDKTFPWPNASNVKFPLITIAALQYHARAYPALIPSEGAVTCKIVGEDPDGKKSERAKRVKDHMNFQITEEDTQWEESMDKALLVQPIIGCAFKKTYFDANKKIQKSELVFPSNLVVNYYTKSLEESPRITHVIPLSRNDCYTREKSGVFLKVEASLPSVPNTDEIQYQQDIEQGKTPPPLDKDTPYMILEQHCFYDLDGDGYEEPYVISVREDTKQVLRIVARFQDDSVIHNQKKEVQSITPEHFFTKIPFIPSPDGGFYDMGFGLLLGATNESINTIINQLIDAGTMANTGGGFLSRGIRIRGGDYTFKPNEWKRVDSTGIEMQQGIVPLPVREPSPTLFNLLNMLIEFGSRIGMATDPMVGVNPGQNTPAETSRNTIAQGEKVFNGIYKRTYRALKEEFRKIYRLNYLYAQEMAPEGRFEYAGGDGAGGVALYSDYFETDKTIVPSADPNISSDSGKLEQAMQLRTIASTSPGFDMYQVNLRTLKALKISNIEQVYPNPKGPNAISPQPNPKVQIEQAKLQLKDKELMLNERKDQLQMLEDARLNQAKIIKLEAEAQALMAEVDDVKNGHMIALLNAQIGLAKEQQRHYETGVKMLYDVIKGEREHVKTDRVGAVEKPTGNSGVSPILEQAGGGGKDKLGSGGVQPKGPV